MMQENRYEAPQAEIREKEERPPRPWLFFVCLIAGYFLTLRLIDPADGQSLLLVILGFFFFLFYVYRPFKLWRSKPIPTEITVLSSTDPGFSVGTEIEQNYHLNADTLTQLGFTEHGLFRMDNSSFGVRKIYRSIFDNPQLKIEGIWLGWPVRPKRQMMSLFLKTRLADGTTLTTTNHAGSYALPPLPGRKRFIFPRVKDPATLLECHKRMLAEEGSFSTPLDLPSGDTLDRLKRQTEEERRDLAQQGYLVLDEKKGVYRLTLKAALIINLRTTPPLLFYFLIRQATEANARLRRWSLS